MERIITEDLSKKEILILLLKTPPEERSKSDLHDIAYLIFVY